MNSGEQQSDITKFGVWGKFIHRLSHGFSMTLAYIFQQKVLLRSWKISAFGGRFQKKGDSGEGEHPSETEPTRYHLFGYKSMKVDISISECPEPKGYSKLIEVMKNHTYNK